METTVTVRCNTCRSAVIVQLVFRAPTEALIPTDDQVLLGLFMSAHRGPFGGGS